MKTTRYQRSRITATATALAILLLIITTTSGTTISAPPKLPVKVSTSTDSSLSKDTRLKLLKLDEAKVSLQAARDLYNDKKKDAETMQELYKQDVVTGKEASDAETELIEADRKLSLAKIDLAKTALSFLQESTHISILDAYQYIDIENRRHMALTITNDSDLDLAMMGMRDGVPEAGIKKQNVPGLLTIDDLYISIKSGSTAIGDPFEIKVSKLPLNATKTLDFKLDNEAEEVSVILKYQNREETRNIFLVKKSTEDIVRVSALQFAQEGQLGSQVSYAIDLERLAETEATFTLEAFNLPGKFRYKFTDKSTQLSRVKFSQGVTKQAITLQVNVPDTLPDSDLKKPISFYAVVGTEGAIAALRAQSRGGYVTEQQMTALKIGFERVELTPRGTGKFESNFSTLYYEIKVGDPISTKMTVKNTGSVDLNDIRFNIEAPYEWKVTLDPEEIESLSPRKEIDVKVTITPPANVEVGAYEVKIEGETDYEGTSVKSSQKDIRIQVSGKTNLTGNLIIVISLILGVVILAVITVKLSRR